MVPIKVVLDECFKSLNKFATVYVIGTLQWGF